MIAAAVNRVMLRGNLRLQSRPPSRLDGESLSAAFAHARTCANQPRGLVRAPEGASVPSSGAPARDSVTLLRLRRSAYGWTMRTYCPPVDVSPFVRDGQLQVEELNVCFEEARAGLPGGHEEPAFSRAEPVTLRLIPLEVPLPPRDTEQTLQEVQGCKALLLEIIRRAAYDWVLYRSSRRLLNKQLAESAYSWLFKEGPGTEEWEGRSREGKSITAFVTICSMLDLDVESVRGHIRRLTPKNVMSVGRPAEYRRKAPSLPAHGSRSASLPRRSRYDTEEVEGRDDA